MSLFAEAAAGVQVFHNVHAYVLCVSCACLSVYLSSIEQERHFSQTHIHMLLKSTLHAAGVLEPQTQATANGFTLRLHIIRDV